MKEESFDWSKIPTKPVYDRDKYFNGYQARIHQITKCDMSELEDIEDILCNVVVRSTLDWLTRRQIDYRIKKAYEIFLELKQRKE